ncbi:ABC transporter substrate-binding protein [Metabacillus niabensis]|uniref:ABC transporter substrate-binding protein n=1 Tax=Metabacillus niabensis TaxID=324854 RepID=UPI0039A30BB9
MTIRKRLIGIGFLTLFALSACDGQEKGATKDNEKIYELKVGYGNLYGAPLADIAIQEGFFEEENLKVEMIGFSGDGLAPLQAKKIDIALTFGSTGPMNFIANGADFSMIGGHMEGGHPLVAKKEKAENYKTLEDYKGKKIATVRLDTLDVYFRSALQEAGIDIEKDVKFIELDSRVSVLEAVKTGKADVGISGTGHLTQTLELGLAPVKWINEIEPDAVCCRVTIRGELSDDEAIAYKKFMKALIKAERVKLENPERNFKASLDRFKNLDRDQINEIVNEPHLINTADPNKKETLEVWEKMINLGYVRKEAENIDMNAYFNLTFYEQALDELIKENPKDDYYKQVLERFNNQNL